VKFEFLSGACPFIMTDCSGHKVNMNPNRISALSILIAGYRKQGYMRKRGVSLNPFIIPV
jgi:hypothetical protein